MRAADGPSSPTTRLTQVATHLAPLTRDVPTEAPSPISTLGRSGPSLILLFGWTAAPRSAIARYAAQYEAFFPGVRTLLFPCVFSDLLPWPARSTADTRRGFDDLLAAVETAVGNILVHLFSGGGAIRFATLAALYRQETGRALPIRMLLCDSAPTDAGVLRRARTLNDTILFAQAPWLAKEVTRPLIVLGLATARGWSVATRQVEADGWEGILSEDFVPKEAVRGYVYSIRDEIVLEEEVQRHIALARQRGLDVEVERYADSVHVGHAKKDPERYWGFVRRLWERSQGKEWTTRQK